jgi:hypothetical protein
VCWPCKTGGAPPNLSGPVVTATSLHKIAVVNGGLANKREAALAEQLASVQTLVSPFLSARRHITALKFASVY